MTRYERRILRILLAFTASFVLFLLLLALAEHHGLSRFWLGPIFIFSTVMMYAVIGIRSRTSDPEDVDLAWEIDAFRFELPIMAAAMDSVVSPATAVAIGELGGVGVLALEGLWTRYDDPEPLLAEIAEIDEPAAATARLQELHEEPIKDELIRDRIKEIRGAGVVSCAAITPQRLPAHADALLAAELDLVVIQGSVVSAEHVTREGDPLNLKTFVRRFDIPVIVGGCASYQAARHLMRTGAAGILVGVGAGATSTTRRVLGVGAAQALQALDRRGLPGA